MVTTNITNARRAAVERANDITRARRAATRWRDTGYVQATRYRVRQQAAPADARMVPNVNGQQYTLPIGPAPHFASVRACRGCPNAHACNYGRSCQHA